MEMYVVVDLEGRIARSRWTGVGTVYGDIKEAQAEAKIRNKKRAGVYSIERLSVIPSPGNRDKMKKLSDIGEELDAMKLVAAQLANELNMTDDEFAKEVKAAREKTKGDVKE